MSAFPVCPDCGNGLILYGAESFRIRNQMFLPDLNPGIHHSNGHGLHLPFPVKPEQQIDGMPYLLSGLDIIRKEAAGATVSGLIEMG